MQDILTKPYTLSRAFQNIFSSNLQNVIKEGQGDPNVKVFITQSRDKTSLYRISLGSYDSAINTEIGTISADHRKIEKYCIWPEYSNFADKAFEKTMEDMK